MADNEGATALWHAMGAGHVKGIALLLEQPSTDVNHRMVVKDDYYSGIEVTPIISVLNGGLGPYDVVSLLVNHPAIDLTCVDGDGRNPLMLAIQGNREDSLVRDMLERRRSAITAATVSSVNQSDRAIVVSGSFDINAVDRHGDTALQLAAQENDVESLKLLLSEDGIEIDPPGHGSEPLLLRATHHLAIEAILAHSSVDVDQVDHLGRSALSDAALRDDHESALLLLRYGARPDLADSSGLTPIARAATLMHGDMVELLERASGII